MGRKNISTLYRRPCKAMIIISPALAKLLDPSQENVCRTSGSRLIPRRNDPGDEPGPVAEVKESVYHRKPERNVYPLFGSCDRGIENDGSQIHNGWQKIPPPERQERQ